MADSPGHAPPAMGPAGFAGTQRMALSPGNLHFSCRTEVDTTNHRFAQAKSGEPMTVAAMTGMPSKEALPGNTELLCPAEGYNRWAGTYDSGLNPLLALEERC